MHSLTEVDVEARTAICAECGPTRVRRQSGQRGHGMRCVGSSRGNPETIKAYAARHWKLSRYGLTPEMFAALVVAQTGRCGICVRPLTDNLRIDHDHVTGRVRGLLCQGCNTGLGLLADGVAGLRAALDYLERAET